MAYLTPLVGPIISYSSFYAGARLVSLSLVIMVRHAPHYQRASQLSYRAGAITILAPLSPIEMVVVRQVAYNTRPFLSQR